MAGVCEATRGGMSPNTMCLILLLILNSFVLFEEYLNCCIDQVAEVKLRKLCFDTLLYVLWSRKPLLRLQQFKGTNYSEVQQKWVPKKQETPLCRRILLYITAL